MAKKNNVKKSFFSKAEIITFVVLIFDLITYFKLNKFINIALLFLAFMSVSIFLVYILGLLFEKKEKRKVYINNILDITLIFHALVIGIILGQLCTCGSHYFYIIPLMVYELVEIVFYHICIYNYKKEKNFKYGLICFLIMNVLFIAVVLLSRVNMEKIHNNLYRV